MAETTISRHVGELVPLTIEHYMACGVNQQQYGIIIKLSMEDQVHRVHGSLAKHMEKLNLMLTG